MKSGIDNNGFLLLIIKFNKKIQSLQQSYIHDSKKKKCIVTSTEPPQINTSELQKSSEVIMLLKYTSLIMTILKLTKNLLLELLIHSKPNINHIKEEIIWINYFMVAQAQLINQCSPKNSQKNNLKKKEVNKKNDFVYIHILYCFSNQRICQVIHKYHPQQRQIYIIYHQKFQYNLYQSLKLIKEFINSQIKNFFYKTFIINFGLEYQSFDLNIEHQKKNNELQMIILN